MHYDVIIYVLVIDFLAILSPGPDFFMVLKNSLTKSHTAGFYTTIGITLGWVFTFSLGIFGVGIIVANSKILFSLVKIAGGAYLCYLALKSIFAKVQIQEPQLDNINEIGFNNQMEYFKQGLLCNITNPKALMFIVALSTYVSEHGNPYTDGWIIIIGSAIATFIWFIIVSFVFGNLRVRKIFYQRQRLINITFGLILLYVASKIIFL